MPSTSDLAVRDPRERVTPHATPVRVLGVFPGPQPVIVLRVEGSLDATLGRRVRRHVRRLSRRYPVICLDLRGLTGIEPDAARTIADARALASANGRRLVMVGASERDVVVS